MLAKTSIGSWHEHTKTGFGSFYHPPGPFELESRASFLHVLTPLSLKGSKIAYLGLFPTQEIENINKKPKLIIIQNSSIGKMRCKISPFDLKHSLYKLQSTKTCILLTCSNHAGALFHSLL